MRTPDDYAKDWNIKDQSADQRNNASGAGTEGVDNESANPYRWKMPPSPEWGVDTSYGHSDDVEAVNLAKEAGKDLLTKGYERGESDGDGGVLETRQAGGSFPQAIPSSNSHDRGSGSDVRSREFSEEGRGFDGTGNDNPHPGTEQIGSSKLPS
jgi:hypothetical protein